MPTEWTKEIKKAPPMAITLINRIFLHNSILHNAYRMFLSEKSCISIGTNNQFLIPPKTTSIFIGEASKYYTGK
jgi:hypothetical protein